MPLAGSRQPAPFAHNLLESMMRTQRKRFLLAVSFFLTAPLASAVAQLDPDTGDEVVAVYPCNAAEPFDPDCVDFGVFLNRDTRTYVYRGNVYRFARRAALKEIKMELAFDGTADLHVAIHQKQPDGTYLRYLDLPDVIIPLAEGCGATVSHVYSTADADPPMEPVIIEEGFDYAVAFAWANDSITHGYGGQGYLVTFRAGQVLGLVYKTLSQIPPLVPDVISPSFYAGVYSMELCFDPQPGACCRASDQQCHEVIESECAGAGDYFHGEYTLCAETPCAFGTCCDPCDACHDPYTPEACGAERVWTTFDCPAGDPELLCPIVTGACCQAGGACTVICEGQCSGTYRGDGTTCTPNFCPGAVGACCVTGGCLNRTQASCASSNGTYKGPGTNCLTLENECGGACCRGFKNNNLEFCQHVATRAECAIDPKGFPYSAYRGDGTTCPNLTPDPNDTCNDRTEVACCLPDGTCINTTTGFCQASWVKGEPHPGVVCEDQPTLCPSRISCCFPDGHCDPMTPNGCTAFGGFAGAGNTCAADACVAFVPTGACCGYAPGLCAVSTEAQCNSQGGLYQGDATNCNAPAVICPGFGACCFSLADCCSSAGDCREGVTSAQCAQLGGDYLGDDTNCPLPCNDQSGACCAITGACLSITESQCNSIEGEFLGSGVSCAAEPCSVGACCLQGACEVRTQAGCLGEYRGDDTTCDGPNPCPCTNDADCDDVNVCTDDTCDPESRCAFTNNSNLCNDQNACTTNDTCSGGECIGGSPPVCDDGDACTDDTCDPATGCVNPPTNCDDGNACTDDTCDPFTGCANSLITCDDSDNCTDDTCDTATGCVYSPITCDDGNACTDDACDPVTGCANSPITCDDGSVCTDDSCDPATGCVYSPIPCDDGDICTDNSCDPITGCVNSPINCDDGNACTTDTCDPVSGCAHLPITCDDASICTNDACDPATGCVFSPIVCDDGDVCTTDSCDPVTGCGIEPITCGDGSCDTTCGETCGSCPQDCCTTVTVLTWESVITHTRSGQTDLVVPLAIPDDNTFSEPRSGIKKIVVTFTGALDPATVVPGTVIICGQKPDPNTPGQFLPVDPILIVFTTATTDGDTKLEINFAPALPNFARYRITLTTGIHDAGGGAIQAGTGGLSRILTALQGDLSGDRRVNSTDVGGCRTQIPRDPIDPAILTEVRGDLNNDKRINSTDVGFARTLVGNDARFIPDPVCP